MRRVWEHCGHPFRAGLYSWQPFETLHWTVQQQLLEAAAAAMELIEAGSLTALGTSDHLLLPEPASNVGDGTRPAAPTATAGDQKEPPLDELWDRVVAAFDAAVEAAREDPETAKKLYDFALYGLGNRGSGNGMREAFTELKIPLDFLSHTDNGDSFA